MPRLPPEGRLSTRSHAVEELAGAREAPLFLTCEHASQLLPEPWRWHARDERLVGTHWAYDLGARELTLELAAVLGASAVLSRFTRLLVDPNRDEEHGDLFRAHADGEPVLLNASIADDERARRIAEYHRPYHAAVDGALVASDAPVLLSIHSFTPRYQGEVREVELGVLFNHDEEHATLLGQKLAQHFPQVAYNEPWSGRLGLIYAAERHAERHGRRALELEVRQDRALDPDYRAALVRAIAELLRSPAWSAVKPR